MSTNNMNNKENEQGEKKQQCLTEWVVLRLLLQLDACK
jgi:hypothetical protein